jgi:tetratricopeptide (TPR) repeat protein
MTRIKKINIPRNFWLLTSGALVLGAPVVLADSLGNDARYLLEQGYYWHSHGDLEQARNLWRKALMIAPDNAEAKQALQEFAEPATGAAPVPAAGQELLRQARELSRGGKYEEAALLYRDAVAARPADPLLAFEYYQTLGGTESGWEEAVAGLEALVSRYPSNSQYALGLAKLKTYRESTRLGGIAELQQLAQYKRTRGEAIPAWRQALTWLSPEETDPSVLQAYLEIVPGDTQIEHGLAGAGKGDSKEARQLANAYALLDRKDNGRAAEAFRRVLDEQPNNADAMAGLGFVKLRQEKFGQAEGLLARAIEIDPVKAERWEGALESARYWNLIVQAREARGGGLPERAKELLGQARAVDPMQPEAQLLLADIETETGNPQSAIPHYRRVLEHNPGYRRAGRALANALAQAGEKEEASQLFSRYGGETGKSTSAWARADQFRAEAQAIAAKDPDAAIAKLLQARALAPDNPWVRLQLGRLYLGQGRDNDAAAVFSDLQGTAPDNLHAQALLAADRLEWPRGLELMEGIPDGQRTAEQRLLINRMWAHQQQEAIADMIRRGDEASVRALVAQLGERAHDDPEVEMIHQSAQQLQLIMSLRQVDAKRRAGQLDQAYAQLLPWLESDADNPDVLMSMAALYMESGDRQEALALYRRVLADDPNNRVAREGEIGAALAMGDTAIAKQKLDAALKETPEAPMLHAMLGWLHLSQGDKASAAQALRQALTQYEIERGDSAGTAHPGGGPGQGGDLASRYPFAPYQARLVAADGSPPLTLGATGNALQSSPAAAQFPFPANRASSFTARGPVTDPSWVESARKDLATLDARNTTFITGGVAVRDRNGRSGLEELVDLEAPVNIQTSLGYNHVVGLQVKPVHLSAGDAAGREIARFGTLALDFPRFRGSSFNQEEEGVAVAGYYRGQNWSLDAGTTPLGFPEENIVGGLRWTPRFGDTSLLVNLERRAVIDSMLSYAGTVDPRTGQTWGGVTRNGGQVVVSQRYDDVGLYGFFGYHFLTGERVKDNQMFQAGGGVSWDAYRVNGKTVTVGADASYRDYDHNLRHFSEGHGGYFSPQQYFAFTVPLRFGGEQGLLSYRLGASLGVQHFEEDTVDVYPDSPALQRRLERLALTDSRLDTQFDGQSQTGFLYGIRGEFEYQVTRNLALGGFAFTNNTDDYHAHGAFAYLRFSFAPQTRTSLTDRWEVDGPFYNVWEY